MLIFGKGKPGVKKNRPFYLLLALFSCLLSSCGENPLTTFSGYVQGKFTYISANSSGTLAELNVKPGEFVKKNQSLFTLEPYPENTEQLAAKARVQQARDEKNKVEATLQLQKKLYERNQLLYRKGVLSREEWEQTTKEYHSAMSSQQASAANLLAEEAQLKKANWATSQKTVTAPIDGLVFDTYFSPFERVGEGKPILALLTQNALRIIFYVPEAALGKLQLQEKVNVYTSGSKDPIAARISYISPREEYTPPIIFSEQEREKLVFRVEALPEAQSLNLHPGQPLTIKLLEDASKS